MNLFRVRRGVSLSRIVSSPACVSVDETLDTLDADDVRDSGFVARNMSEASIAGERTCEEGEEKGRVSSYATRR